MHDDTLSPRILRLRSLQSAVDNDWRDINLNVRDLAALAHETISKSVRAATSATYLLCIYTGIEQMLQRIAEQLNGGSPAGSAWHRELLDSMARSVKNLVWSKMQPFEELPTTITLMDEALTRFHEFVDTLCSSV